MLENCCRFNFFNLGISQFILCYPRLPSSAAQSPAKHKVWDVRTNEMLWMEYYHIYETKFNLASQIQFSAQSND